MNHLNGLRVIASPYLTEPGEPYQVRRSWKERLFSRPWTPLIRTRVVVPKVPMKGGYQLGDGSIVMHPQMIQQLKLAVLQKDSA